MTAPPLPGSGTYFVDTSFEQMNFDRSPTDPGPSNTSAHTIDFTASQAYFNGFHSHSSPWGHQPAMNNHSPNGFDSSPNGSNHSPTGSGHSPHEFHHSPPFGFNQSSYGFNHSPPNHPPFPFNHGHGTSPTSPMPAISGLDPISKLGFTSNRASPQSHLGATGTGPLDAPQQTYFPNQPYPQPHPPQHPQIPTHTSQFSPPPFQSQPGHPFSYETMQRNDEAVRAEVARRNRLRETEKARRTMVIQKQVSDGMAALKLEKDDAAQRTAEVERRNKQREEEKEKRRLAIEKQVADGIRAIQLEKERERVRVQEDRKACRKWLSDLATAPTPSSSSSTSTAADQATDTIDLYTALGRQLRGFWQQSRPSASSQAHRKQVVADVQLAIDRRWPGQGLQVAAFGSSVTGLITESSDLDLVLLDPTRPYGVGTPLDLRRAANKFVRQSGGMPEWYSTNQIANALRNTNKFKSVVPISGANVPIVKMIHKKYDIPADININERFGLFNSQLIQAYAELQPQIVRPLIFFLKHWYSRCDLNDPAGKRGSMTFSSYTIALMALQVLQVEGVLPNLQSPALLKSLEISPEFLYSRFKRPRRGKNARANAAEDDAPPQKYNVTFATSGWDLEPYKAKAIELATDGTLANGASASASVSETSTDRLLGRMLISFIRFYTELDRRREAVSVVNGSPLQRKKSSSPGHVLFDSASEDDAPTQDLLETASRDAETRAALRDEQKDIWAGEELVVQDPFIIDRNTSRNIKTASITKWQTMMQNALTHFCLQKGAESGQAPRVRLDDAPLILDLCLPSSLRSEVQGNKETLSPDDIRAAGQAAAAEPLRLEEEEAAAQVRALAKQAAQDLRKTKKKKARSSKQAEARRLQEEAAIVEDMIDGLESGRAGFSGDVWRLRMDNHDSPSTSNGDDAKSKDLSATAFTFSVTKSAVAPESVITNGEEVP